MFLSIILTGILCFILFKIYRFNSSDNGIPIYPGSWPLLGHLPLIISANNTRLWKFIENVSEFSLKNDGYCAVLLGPFKYYVLTDPDDCAKFLNSTPNKHYVYTFGCDWLGNGLLTGDVNTWKAHRKVMNPIFSQQGLNSFLPIFNKKANRLVERFSTRIGNGYFDHEPDILVVALETIFQTALGTDEAEDQINNKKYLEAADNNLKILIRRLKYFWLHFKTTYDWSSLKKEHMEYLKVVKQHSKKLIQKRRIFQDSEPKNEEDCRPFIDTLLKIQADNILTEEEVLDEVNTLIMTGYESTATAITYILMILGEHKDAQERIYQEIQEVFGDSDRDVEKPDLNRLVYLEAVLKEILRYYPLVSIIGRTASAGLKLKKREFNAGDQCLIVIHGIHRHSEWGPDVNEFKPERWLNPETLPKNLSNLFVPFSVGKRHCIGKTYAMMSMKITLVHVIRRYKLFCDFSKVEFKMELLTKVACGRNIKIEPRTLEKTVISLCT